MAATRKNTKVKILEKALELFSQHGYGGASVRDISGAVGIRESAIYNHFKSKESIINEIINRKINDSIETAILSDELINEMVNTHNFLSMFASKLIKLWSSKSERDFFRLLLMEQNRKSNEGKMIFKKYFENLRSMLWMIFDELIKHRLIKKIDAKRLTDEYLGYLIVIRIEYLSSSDLKNYDEATDAVKDHVEFFWQSIKK